jgi:hypothetical protein
MPDFDLTGISVFIAMPVSGEIPPATVRSLLETQAACSQRNIHLDIEFNIGSTVFHARSKRAHSFLKGTCTRFFQIDSDMVWSGDDFLRLLALSTKMDCVCAIYTARCDPPKFFINVDDITAELTENEYGCLPIKGTGLGFTVVSRKIIEELAAKAPKIRFMDLPDDLVAKIFRFDEPNGEARGEDMAFFSDVTALGYTINLDPHIALGHVGAKEFRAPFLDYINKVR